jgi:hypothetical protein
MENIKVFGSGFYASHHAVSKYLMRLNGPHGFQAPD